MSKVKTAAVAAGLVALLGLTGGAYSTAHGTHIPMPDHKLTPGVADTSLSLHTICTTSTTTRRNTSESTKREVYAEYGAVHKTSGDYEVDHLIPLELGGADVKANLWPEPNPSFHEKDRLENRLHSLVCANKVSLAKAQHDIAADWTAAYETYMGEPAS